MPRVPSISPGIGPMFSNPDSSNGRLQSSARKSLKRFPLSCGGLHGRGDREDDGPSKRNNPQLVASSEKKAAGNPLGALMKRRGNDEQIRDYYRNRSLSDESRARLKAMLESGALANRR